MRKEKQKRNILLIFTDQQRYDTIGALGNPIIKTPTLNRMVERGVSFTRAYTPCPVCVPARHSLMSGHMPHRTGCLDNNIMPDGYKSIMEILSEHGYQTHGVGKMHFTFKETGDMAMWGFESRDTSEEVNGAERDDFKIYLKENGYNHVKDPHGVRSEMYYIPQPSQLPDVHHNTTWVADKSIEFLEHRDKDRPFFLMTSFIKPHPPFESPTPWNKLYRALEMPLPKRPEGREHLLTYWNRYQNRYKYRDQGVDNNLVRTMKAAYYSAISFIDFNVGRIFNYMEDNGLMDNTMIIYISDHGEMLGDYDCFGKRCFLDSSARIPMLMYYPGVEDGSVCTRPVSLIDIAPTFLQWANIEQMECYEGKSLFDTASGKGNRDAVYGQFQEGEYGMYMSVNQKYKYIHSAPDNKDLLFDLIVDPEETKNLAYNPLYESTVKAMKQKTINYFKCDEYTDFLDENDWKCYPNKNLLPDPDAELLLQDPPDSIPHIKGYGKNSEH